jgi:hypothetical protein
VTGATDFSPDSSENAPSWWDCPPERKANETHWPEMERAIATSILYPGT